MAMAKPWDQLIDIERIKEKELLVSHPRKMYCVLLLSFMGFGSLWRRSRFSSRFGQLGDLEQLHVLNNLQDVDAVGN